jgi:hypothetical protein
LATVVNRMSFKPSILTVPSKPTAYRTASPEIFSDARELHKNLESL